VFPDKTGIGGGNTSGTGGIKTDEFIFVIACFVGKAQIGKLLCL